MDGPNTVMQATPVTSQISVVCLGLNSGSESGGGHEHIFAPPHSQKYATCPPAPPPPRFLRQWIIVTTKTVAKKSTRVNEINTRSWMTELGPAFGGVQVQLFRLDLPACCPSRSLPVT